MKYITCGHNPLRGPVAGCEACDWQWTGDMLEQAYEARHGLTCSICAEFIDVPVGDGDPYGELASGAHNLCQEALR